jgi:WD40 repeat protein
LVVGHIYSIFTWDACSFATASQDGTTRLWDIRQSDCVNVIPARPSSKNQSKLFIFFYFIVEFKIDSPVAAVAVDGSGQLLAAGYEDSSCLLYDLRGKRIVQVYQPHSNEIRSIRFSVHSYYLLTASYDKKVVMTHLSGKTIPLINFSISSSSFIFR